MNRSPVSLAPPCLTFNLLQYNKACLTGHSFNNLRLSVFSPAFSLSLCTFFLLFYPSVSARHLLYPLTPTCPPPQRVCVSAPEAAEFPQHQEDGGDEEGTLFHRRPPRPRSVTAGFTPAHAWSRVRTKHNDRPIYPRLLSQTAPF